MATTVLLRHRESGIVKNGLYGFSWTTLLFGMCPALFRGDFLTFVGGSLVLIPLGFVTFGVGAFTITFVWAFLYNKHYTQNLLERGYEFADSDENVTRAKLELDIQPTT